MSASVSVTDNASGSPQTVPLTGTGLEAITVNWGTSLQTIDGFGASATSITLNSGMPSGDMDTFFRTDTGIGLSLVRLEIVPDTTDCSAWFSTAEGWGYNGTCVTSATGSVLQGTLATAQGALSRSSDVKFFATQWSPAGAYKSNGQFNAGGSVVETTGNFTAIASELAGGAALIQSNGVPLIAIGPQNEPDISAAYPSCTWTASNLSDLVPYLFTALSGSTGIMLADGSGWATTYINTAMGAHATEISLIGTHGYSTATPGALSITGQTTQHLWQTEDSNNVPTYDGSIANALTWGQIIYNYLVNAHANAWVWWWLSDEQYEGFGTDNSALTDSSGNIPKRVYMTGQWSKFVRPGWHMVSVTNVGSLLVTGFENSVGTKTAVVVINMSGSAVTGQYFNVGSQMGASVTPWVTSATQNLVAQTSVAVSGGVFPYTIPASSIVTFSGVTTTFFNPQHGTQDF
jgi:O-glycosyl hydrolase